MLTELESDACLSLIAFTKPAESPPSIRAYKNPWQDSCYGFAPPNFKIVSMLPACTCHHPCIRTPRAAVTGRQKGWLAFCYDLSDRTIVPFASLGARRDL